MLLQTKLEEVTWHISETTFEFCARAVEVGLITQKGGKKYNSNSRRRSSMTAASLFAPQCRPSLKRTFSRSEGRLFETARLLYVPGIVMAVSHSVFDAATAYSHHDVYLYPAGEGGGGLGRCVDDDKYAYLRSRKMSSKANFELRILDSSTEPLTVNARLDVLHGLLEAVNQAAQQKIDPEFDSPCVSRPGSPHYRPDFPTLTPLTPSKTPINPGPGPTPLTAPPSGLMSKVRRSGLHDYPALEVKEKCPLTIFSIMRQWDVQIALGRIVVCSWPSRNALSGVVLTLAGLDLQLRLLREVPLDYRSSAPFFIPMSPSSLSPPSELSLSPVSSAPFAYNLSSTSEEADRQHRPSLSPINEDVEFMGSPETVKAQKKDKLNFVTFSENTRGGLELRGDSDEELKYPTASRKNGRKPLVLSPSKQQQREKDKDAVKVKPIRTSSLSNESEASSCKDSTEDTTRSTTEDEDFPMQVEHLFTEIHFADIYARDWSVTSRTQSGMKTQSERRDSINSTERSSFCTTNLPDSMPGSGKGGERDGRGSEPANVTDLQRLFRPLCRLAHASRVVVSLTEDGEVAGKLDTFETVGLLPVSQQRSQQQTQGAQMSQEMRVAGANAHKEIGLSPRLHLYIGKERRKSSLDNTDATRIKYLQSRFSASPVQRRVCSRPSIDAERDLAKGGEREDGVKKCPLSLVDPASMPPTLSLSPSIGTRNQNEAGSSVPSSSYSPLGGRGGCAILLNKLHRESSTGSNNSTTPKSKSSKAHASASGSRVPEGVSSFGNKIWGLRMVDMRLLMTIAIRDSIFGYVGRCFEYFEYDVLVRI